MTGELWHAETGKPIADARRSRNEAPSGAENKKAGPQTGLDSKVVAQNLSETRSAFTPTRVHPPVSSVSPKRRERRSRTTSGAEGSGVN